MTGYYSAIKKNEILPFATAWMDLEGIMLSEINQSDKGKYYMFSSLCGSKKQYKQTNKTETDSQIQRTDWWLPEVKGVEGLGKGEGIKKYKLVVTTYSQGLEEHFVQYMIV